MEKAVAGMETEQVVVVTAGASGIGRCIAETFLAEGYSVHICDVNGAAITDFQQAYPQLTASIADVAEAEQVESLFEDVMARYGRLDVLVNNAGISGPTAAVEDIAVEDWDRTIAVDLSGQFYVTRAAVPLMKKAASGSIVNISSNAGLLGCPLRSPYAASKWAIIGLTKTWAMELGPDNIRVNALCPCSVNGERIDGVIDRMHSTGEFPPTVFGRPTSGRVQCASLLTPRT